MNEPPSTFNGLLSVKPGNEPQQGETRTFVIENRLSKSGKPYTKIKSAGRDFGGTPFRILAAEKTDFVDAHGNLSFNVEIEAAIAESMEQMTNEEIDTTYKRIDRARERPVQAPQAPPARSNGEKIEEYADYAARIFEVNWRRAVKWIGTLPEKDLQEMSAYEYYDLQMRHAQHGAIETGKIIRKERF